MHTWLLLVRLRVKVKYGYKTLAPIGLGVVDEGMKHS